MSSVTRAQVLADRLIEGAAALAAFASSLNDAEWQTRLPGDGRKIGVVVNHVGFSDEQLDRAASVSLYGGATLTCQFVLEDHAIRHSYHHLAKIRAALKR